MPFRLRERLATTAEHDDNASPYIPVPVLRPTDGRPNRDARAAGPLPALLASRARTSAVAGPKSPAPEPAKTFSHTAPTPPSTPSPVAPVEGTAPTGPDAEQHEEITFEKKQESADSILSPDDESDDEVFSSQTGSKVPAPIVPDFDPEPLPPAAPPVDHSASKIPTMELRTPVEIDPSADFRIGIVATATTFRADADVRPRRDDDIQPFRVRSGGAA